jgi:hypothetical protein
MTRGRRGTLALRRRALPSPPPCRFIPALSQDPPKARLPLRRAPPLLRPPHQLRAHLRHHQRPRHHQHQPRLVPPHRPDPAHPVAGLPAHRPQPAHPQRAGHPPGRQQQAPPPPGSRPGPASAAARPSPASPPARHNKAGKTSTAVRSRLLLTRHDHHAGPALPDPARQGPRHATHNYHLRPRSLPPPAAGNVRAKGEHGCW